MSRDPKADVLAELRAKLSAMDAADEQKAALSALLDQLEPPRSASERRQAERVAFARHLLDASEARPIIRDRLMARYEIGPAQSYRIIGEALQVPGKAVSQLAEK